MTQFLTAMGEILIDFLPLDAGGSVPGFLMYPGGAPFNVAVGLARLGQPVAFAGKVATDLFGRFLQAQVAREGIDPRFLLPADGPSTLAFAAMENGDATWAFYGEGAADTLLTAAEVPAALFAETAILHCGSISLLRGTTPQAVLAAVERLKGRALISFDPNVRPGLVRDEADYRAVLDRLFALADVVKLSALDIGWLAPGRAVGEVATDLQARGAGLVAVTQGGAGVLVVRGADRLLVPAVRVPVVDTVGAGDAFSAGLLAGLAERGVTSRAALDGLYMDDLVATLRFAAAVAALTCTRAGADPPRREEVRAFLAEHTEHLRTEGL
jgi:fructokinase